MMIRTNKLALGVVLVGGLAGCANMSSGEQRTLSGAAIGTAAGALIGELATGQPLHGAALGAAAGALGGWLLKGYGYVANVEQSTTAVQGIRLSVSIFPVIAIVLCVIALFVYGIGRKVEYQMQDELAERRKSYAG